MKTGFVILIVATSDGVSTRNKDSVCFAFSFHFASGLQSVIISEKCDRKLLP